MSQMKKIILLLALMTQCVLADDSDDKGEFDTLQKTLQDLQQNPQSYFRFVNGFTNYINYFEEIDGKVLQVLDEGLLVSTHSSADYSPDIPVDSVYSGPQILVLNYGKKAVDEDRIFCRAEDIGTFTYESVAGSSLTIRKYDCGIPVMPSKELLESKIDEIKIKLSNNQYWINLQEQAAMAEATKNKLETNRIKGVQNALKFNQDAADKGDAYPVSVL